MKKIIFILCIFFMGISYILSLGKRFNIDTSKLLISSDSKRSNVVNEFNSNYNISYNGLSSNEELKKEIMSLSKKVTFLLLGEGDKAYETSKEYYERRKDYLDLRYNPIVPKDPNSLLGLDENSQEYKDDVVSGISVPVMFNVLDELNVNYNRIGSIRVSINDNMIISVVNIPNVSIKKEDSNNPMNYITINTNLILYYYFKKLNDEYKLYYLFGETTNELDDIFNEMVEEEKPKSFSISNNNKQINDIYDYKKLNEINDKKLKKIYEENSSNVLILNAYYDARMVSSANGFLISDGLVITSWSFMEKILINSQFFVVKDNNGKQYDIDGIVTANPSNDWVIIKLKEKIKTNTSIGNIDDMSVEEPVISLSSKTGIGLTIQKGIITSKDDYIQSSIPLQEVDAGSPLYNANGKVIGMNTSKMINTSISMALNSKVLSEIKDKFDNINFSSIDTISFDELKEKYYYTNYSEENIINLIPKSKWEKYKKIGDLENQIKLKLVKASFDNNVISLRYYNGLEKYISGMQLAAPFKAKLIESGFEQSLDSKTKCIFNNDEYKIVLIEEFDYLIIVMVKL